MRARFAVWTLCVLSCAGSGCATEHAGGEGIVDTDAGPRPDAPPPHDAAPRLIAPPSLSGTSAAHPSFRWRPPEGADGALLELCADRACTSVIETVAATGSSGTPTDTLPPGVVFWRVRATTAGVAAPTVSATWELFVSPSGGAGSATSGPVLDANGDGLADVVIGGTDEHADTYVFHGSPSGLVYATTLQGGSSGMGSIAAGVDVNGDGFGDVVIGAAEWNTGGTARIHLGSARGVDPSPAVTLHKPGPPEMLSNFGSRVTALGDVDGDGYGDIAIGDPMLPGTSIGAVHVYFGSADGIHDAPDLTFGGGGERGMGFGWTVEGAGDVDADGHADLFGSAWGWMDWPAQQGPYPGTVSFFAGDATGARPIASWTEIEAAASSTLGDFGFAVAGAGDLDGDGFGEVAVCSSGGSWPTPLYVYRGTASGPDVAHPIRIAQPDGAHDFGFTISGSHDVNGDGFVDLAIGSSGGAYLLLGSPTGLEAAPPLLLPGTDTAPSLIVVSVGDVDGDGFGDLVTGGPELAGAFFIHGGPTPAAPISVWPPAEVFPPTGVRSFGAAISRLPG